MANSSSRRPEAAIYYLRKTLVVAPDCINQCFSKSLVRTQVTRWIGGVRLSWRDAQRLIMLRVAAIAVLLAAFAPGAPVYAATSKETQRCGWQRTFHDG